MPHLPPQVLHTFKKKDMEAPIHFNKENVIETFKSFILDKSHPCVMAKSVFKGDNYDLHTYNKLGSPLVAEQMIKDIENYIENYDFDDNIFKSFIAVFPEHEIVSEIEFENLLWRQLQFLHEKDNTPWDDRVSDDPDSANFSFSLAGRAFYVIGMHPKSSRIARQTPWPALVFNLHAQFEKLREMGVYQKVRDRIRKRDEKLQGSINPMLEDFGESSEALQYSGRQVSQEWKCPFHKKQ